MPADSHIFISEDDRTYTVRREGLNEHTVFPSLSEAIRNLRTHGGDFVVIQEEGSPFMNRIPLRF